MKSGNFWLWNVIEEIMNQAGRPRKSFIQTQPIYELAKTWELAFDRQAEIDFVSITPERFQYQIVPVFYWPIEDEKAYVDSTTHVWTHSAMRAESLKRFRLFEKIVYIIRDPRDVAVSYHRFSRNAFHQRFYGRQEKLTPQQDWGVHVLSFLTAQQALGAHVVFYERLRQNWVEELDRLLAYLEVELAPSQRNAVHAATTFDALKQRNALHLAKGELYGWTRDLDAKQQENFTYIHDTMLELLEYPLTKADAEAGKLPRLPSEAEIAAAIPNLWTVDRLAATV